MSEIDSTAFQKQESSSVLHRVPGHSDAYKLLEKSLNVNVDQPEAGGDFNGKLRMQLNEQAVNGLD